MQGSVASVAAAVRHVRLQRKLSAKEVSRRAHLSPAYVSKVENGECEPSVRTFGAIAAVLGMSPMEVWVAVVSEAQELLSHPEQRIDA